jgi:hypothetical protein
MIPFCDFTIIDNLPSFQTTRTPPVHNIPVKKRQRTTIRDGRVAARKNVHQESKNWIHHLPPGGVSAA